MKTINITLRNGAPIIIGNNEFMPTESSVLMTGGVLLLRFVVTVNPKDGLCFVVSKNVPI